MNLLRSSQKSPQATINAIQTKFLRIILTFILPVNAIGIEDHYEPVHTEDDGDDDHGHLGDLQNRMKEEGMESEPNIP